MREAYFLKSRVFGNFDCRFQGTHSSSSTVTDCHENQSGSAQHIFPTINPSSVISNQNILFYSCT